MRQLSNFAMKLAIVNRGLDLARVPQPLLDSITSDDPAADPPSPTSPHRLLRHATPLTPTRIREALERNQFEPAKAARDLSVARSTIYRHMHQDPNLSLLGTLSNEEFRRQLAACDGDFRVVAERLRVSYRAARLRARKT